MRSIVTPARAGILATAIVLAGCASGGASSAAAPTPTTAASSVPPSLSPVPAASDGVPSGWQRVEIEDRGFAIALPAGWEVMDLTSGDIDSMLEALGDDPQLEAFGDQLPSLLASGVALWAVSLDANSASAGFATNLNVLVEENMPFSFDAYVAANASFVENTFGVEVEREAVQLPAGEAARLAYVPTIEGAGTYQVTQYVVAADGRAVIATFSRAIGDEFEALEPVFLDIMETVGFLP